MGKGKLKKFAAVATFDHVFERTFEQLEETPFELKGRWRQDFFKNDNPVVLELGCGKGEYAVELGKHFPNKNFIGVDIKGARLFTGAKQALEAGMENVAFIRSRIELIERFFDKDEVDEIWITFPDPQMKKTRKRLTATNFIEKYRLFLKKDGLVHLKTDSDFLYNYTGLMLQENNFQVFDNIADIYAQDEVSELLNIKTHYELQWLGRGKLIKYLCFNPHQEQLIEPDVDIEFDDYRSYGRNRRDQSIKKGIEQSEH